MAQRATISDLAAKAGVSVSTIERILSGRETVRPKTAEKVLAAAEEIGFYGLPLVRNRLGADKPAKKLGILLLQSHRTFYRLLGSALQAAAQESSVPVEVLIEYLNDLSPEAIAARMLAIGEVVDAIAVVAAQHSRISHAIEVNLERGVPTYGLISELTAACGTGYIGLDNWRVGRTAGWAMSRLCRQPGRVAILMGNHRYRCQELNEAGFRSFFREHAPEFTLLEAIQTFEDKTIAADITDQMLRREPDLVGIYHCGGGAVGVIEALKSSGRAKSLVTIGHEITEHQRLGLLDQELSLLICHPIDRLAREAINLMQQPVEVGGQPMKCIVGYDLITPESV